MTTPQLEQILHNLNGKTRKSVIIMKVIPVCTNSAIGILVGAVYGKVIQHETFSNYQFLKILEGNCNGVLDEIRIVFAKSLLDKRDIEMLAGLGPMLSEFSLEEIN